MPAPGGRVEDQIVRTDLHELYERDLQGKALAYTPFCDSRKETEGFRYAADTLLPGALFSPPCIVSFFLGFLFFGVHCGVWRLLGVSCNCLSNRFWKQGYWYNHLRGAPYHISALYVVDIKRCVDLRSVFLANTPVNFFFPSGLEIGGACVPQSALLNCFG